MAAVTDELVNPRVQHLYRILPRGCGDADLAPQEFFGNIRDINDRVYVEAMTGNASALRELLASGAPTETHQARWRSTAPALTAAIHTRRWSCTILGPRSPSRSPCGPRLTAS